MGFRQDTSVIVCSFRPHPQNFDRFHFGKMGGGGYWSDNDSSGDGLRVYAKMS